MDDKTAYADSDIREFNRVVAFLLAKDDICLAVVTICIGETGFEPAASCSQSGDTL